MTQVVFKRSGQPAVEVKATFDGKKLKFDPAGKAVTNVVSGAYYSLSWIAMGTAGKPWSLEMTKPPAVAFGISKTLPPDGKDSNTEWIYIP
jgi:hypothetical protein